MVFGKMPFIDQSELRVGSFISTGIDPMSGKRWVKFLPLNSVGRPVIISNINPDDLRIVPRHINYPGTFPQYAILLAGENGSSWFLREYLGNILPQLLEQNRKLREDVEVQKAAIETRERQLDRRETTILDEFMKKSKILDQRGEQKDKKRGGHA